VPAFMNMGVDLHPYLEPSMFKCQRCGVTATAFALEITEMESKMELLDVTTVGGGQEFVPAYSNKQPSCQIRGKLIPCCDQHALDYGFVLANPESIDASKKKPVRIESMENKRAISLE
jgi:hypothetical protein